MKKKHFPKLFAAFAVTFVSIAFNMNVEAQNMFRKINDYDGDGKTDYAITRIQNNQRVWYIWQSSEGMKVAQWGLDFIDWNTAGDYDGDGKTDIAVFRDSTSFPPIYAFWVLRSQDNTLAKTEFQSFSNMGSAPMNQDYNGDGKMDPAVWLGEFGLTTSVTGRYSGTNSGFSTSIPARNVPIRIGNMDSSDESAEISYYHIDNNLVTIKNLAASASRSVQFGLPSDKYLPADFDGDGIGDLTIWRSSNGNWWWLKSSDSTYQVVNWGLDGDTPVPGDYDGDGKTDLAIWRPGSTQSYYWIYGSQAGVSVFPWGLSGDTVVRP